MQIQNIPIIIGFVVSLIILYKGDIIMGNTEAWAIVVALISVTGSLILHFFSFRKDSNTIGKVKEDTATLLPEVKTIDENTKKIRDQVTEQVIPNLNQMTETKNGVTELVNELNYQKRLKQETSHYANNMDIFISGIKNIYEVNARLESELKEEKTKNSILLAENYKLEQELATYKEREPKTKSKSQDIGLER